MTATLATYKKLSSDGQVVTARILIAEDEWGRLETPIKDERGEDVRDAHIVDVGWMLEDLGYEFVDERDAEQAELDTYGILASGEQAS